MAMYPHNICRTSQAIVASWIPTLRTLVEIWRNTTQFSKYRTVEAHAATAGTRPTYCDDTDVETVARGGLNSFK